MATTDLILLGLTFFLIWRGASRGFFRSIAGPLSMIIATVLSVLYYQTTKNILVSLLIGLLGPIVLNFILAVCMKTFQKPDWQPSTASRVGGAILTLAWGWIFIFLTLLLLAVLPPLGHPLEAMHKDMHRSVSYSILKPFVERLRLTKPKTITPDIASLAKDPRFQKILQDPELQKEITDQNFAALLSNPKMMELTQQLTNDPQTMKKLMDVYQQTQGK